MKTFLWKSLPLLLAAATLAGQTIVPIPTPRNISSLLPNVPPAPADNVLPTDVLFPHFAFGGG